VRRLIRTLVVGAAVGLGAATVGATAIGTATPAVHAAHPTFDAISTRAGKALGALHDFEATGNPRDLLRYRRHRQAAASLTAESLGYPELDMVTAWTAAPLDHQQAVLAALTQLGVPYRYASSEPGVGFDCSGLTSFAWRSAGHDLVRQSGGQISAARPLDRVNAKAGDLVQYPGHVMLFLGVGDAVVHSVTYGRTVEIDVISANRAAYVRFGDPAD
jgi:cell wall-associated NlpC family hydrolase